MKELFLTKLLKTIMDLFTVSKTSLPAKSILEENTLQWRDIRYSINVESVLEKSQTGELTMDHQKLSAKLLRDMEKRISDELYSLCAVPVENATIPKLNFSSNSVYWSNPTYGGTNGFQSKFINHHLT